MGWGACTVVHRLMREQERSDVRLSAFDSPYVILLNDSLPLHELFFTG